MQLSYRDPFFGQRRISCYNHRSAATFVATGPKGRRSWQINPTLAGSGEVFPLPDADPTLLAPPGGDSREVELSYFDPVKWDAEQVERLEGATDDPIASRRGRVEGQGTAALFLSDFHLADGTAAGDDFLETHLRPR